jgi:hypothetical protein
VLGTGLALVNFGLDEVLNPRLRSLRAIRKKPSVFDDIPLGEAP